MPKEDERPRDVEFEVTLKVKIGYSREDCKSDEEWVELLQRMRTWDLDDMLDILSGTYESSKDLIQSSNASYRPVE